MGEYLYRTDLQKLSQLINETKIVLKECSLSKPDMVMVARVIEKNILTISQKRIKQFQDTVFSFYQHNKRDLPWRRTTDPYKILLSELMLQQTQVSRVIKYYEQWIRKWPTIHDLAVAKRVEVLKAWMGLGYNTRAVNLHKAAQKIAANFKGDILKAMQQYKEIPGVGRYTSQAVQIFSTNADLTTVDTNIRRIFINEFQLSEEISDKELWEFAARCLPYGRSRDWHNALMDYGALCLTAQKTGIKAKTKQTRFEGSDRQIRARILKILLDHDASFAELTHSLGIETIRLQQILARLIHERLITVEKNQYHLME
jgi:A/G-specific adenine glycosylase